ncbi:hypothetical protein BS78_03G092200 [Paspalum vaginatum]|nr:hypothetical protein BS78_03G092200 [Paspalum vaginatum]
MCTKTISSRHGHKFPKEIRDNCTFLTSHPAVEKRAEILGRTSSSKKNPMFFFQRPGPGVRFFFFLIRSQPGQGWLAALGQLQNQTNCRLRHPNGSFSYLFFFLLPLPPFPTKSIPHRLGIRGDRLMGGHRNKISVLPANTLRPLSLQRSNRVPWPLDDDDTRPGWRSGATLSLPPGIEEMNMGGVGSESKDTSIWLP